MRLVVAVLLLLSCLEARAELTCAQLGAIAQQTVGLRNQGASLKRLLDDVDRGALKQPLTPRELEMIKEVVQLSFEGSLSPTEVVEMCEQNGMLRPSRGKP